MDRGLYMTKDEGNDQTNKNGQILSSKDDHNGAIFYSKLETIAEPS